MKCMCEDEERYPVHEFTKISLFNIQSWRCWIIQTLPLSLLSLINSSQDSCVFANWTMLRSSMFCTLIFLVNSGFCFEINLSGVIFGCCPSSLVPPWCDSLCYSFSATDEDNVADCSCVSFCSLFVVDGSVTVLCCSVRVRFNLL